MKIRKTLNTIILIAICVIFVIPFQSCNPDRRKRREPLVYKPNIYIYPEKNVQLEVTIEFPLGGEIINSIPVYNKGWNIGVDTNGLIDNKYSYLFYESRQPDVWQNTEGWIVTASELEAFFRDNMKEYGFDGQEINDFIEYWIPRLNFYRYYSVYPQTIDLIDDVIRLNFSKEPDHILRLFYLVEGSDLVPDKLTDPEIETFTRKGFFVTEWGVIL